MKISKRWLKRIIKEEKAKLLSEQTPADLGIAAAQRDARPPEHGVFDERYIAGLITTEIDDYLLNSAQRQSLTAAEAKTIDRALRAAADVIYDFVE